VDLDLITAAGVRRITVDRPGVGFSDPQPGRALTDWPNEVRVLADHLGLERLAVLGTSGGGPYAAAWCYALPDRIARASLVGTMGPPDRRGAFDGMNRGEAGTMILARRAPLLARWLVGTAVFAERHRPGTVYRGLMRALPEMDRRVASAPDVRKSLMDSFALAFHQRACAGRYETGPSSPRRRAFTQRTFAFQFTSTTVVDDRAPRHHARDLADRLPE
jgi:pimeloyl-ACP methyl ester carboxylesterase